MTYRSITLNHNNPITAFVAAEAAVRHLHDGDLIAWLTDVHYLHFMARPDFWSRPTLKEQDKRCCVLLSDLRQAPRRTPSC
jgi:hypothetical protein